MHRLSYYAQFQRGFSEKYRREEADMIAEIPMLVYIECARAVCGNTKYVFRKNIVKKKFIKNKEKTL